MEPYHQTTRDRRAMTKWRSWRSFLLLASGLLAMCGAPAWAQERIDSSQSNREVQKPEAPTPTKAEPHGSRDEHRFWDQTNGWLFAGVGTSRTLDYFSTLNMRRRGRQEILLTNDAVDNHAAFAVIEAAGTGVSIGASYLFHRSGHHKLERWVSIVHFGLATTGSVRNYSLKTFHARPTSPAP